MIMFENRSGPHSWNENCVMNNTGNCLKKLFMKLISTLYETSSSRGMLKCFHSYFTGGFVPE